jgi:tetrahydromethanopterin S-methyltransferase subunit B
MTNEISKTEVVTEGLSSVNVQEIADLDRIKKLAGLANQIELSAGVVVSEESLNPETSSTETQEVTEVKKPLTIEEQIAEVKTKVDDLEASIGQWNSTVMESDDATKAETVNTLGRLVSKFRDVLDQPQKG